MRQRFCLQSAVVRVDQGQKNGAGVKTLRAKESDGIYFLRALAIRVLSIDDQHGKLFHLLLGAHSIYKDQTLHIFIDDRPAYLFGLKSFVTIDPASMTRLSFGRSALAKVCKWLSIYATDCGCNAQLTTSSWASPSFLPTSLFCHSLVLSPPAELVTGSISGMVKDWIVLK